MVLLLNLSSFLIEYLSNRSVIFAGAWLLKVLLILPNCGPLKCRLAASTNKGFWVGLNCGSIISLNKG